jgi:exonuclease SbcC
MITLTSIRIRNFRAIKELTFKPQEHGITGIFGANGAGKSSILTAVMFALYGFTPKNITVGGLRNNKSTVNEECSVSVVFQHLGETIEMLREIRGHNNRVVINVYVNGEAETKGSVGAGAAWITKRLGISADEFLTAFVIRQKELDKFVTAQPADRKKIIERLAGVETINNAVKAARKNEDDSRKAVDSLPGSQDQVDSAGETVDYYTQAQEDSEYELRQISKVLEALNEERIVYNEQIKTLSDQQNRLNTIQNRVNSLSAEIPSLEKQLQRVEYVTDIKDTEDIETLRAQYKTVREELMDLLKQQSAASHSQQQYSNEKDQLVSRETALVSQLSKLETTVDKDPTVLVDTREKLTTQVETNNRRVVQLNSQNADLDESLQMLHDNDDCPTCKTHLVDPEALRQQFRKIIASNNDTIAELIEEKAQLQTENIQLIERQKAYDLYSTLVEEKTKNTQRQKELEELLGELTAKLTNLSTVIEQKTVEQDKLAELGSKAKTLKEDRALHYSLTERKEIATLDLLEARGEEQELNSTFSPLNLRKAQDSLERVRLEFVEASQKNAEISSKATEAKVRFQSAKTNYNRAYEQWEKKKVIQHAHATKSLTTDMLEKFRQEIVSSIAPEISEYATSLISDMTNGDFTEVKLDDNFQASLVDANGEELSTAYLSGGEESVVALALLLAVGSLISGGNPELLWLDEPLTAQDPDRTTAILSVIRRLPINQILLINHGQAAQDIVDHEITMVKQ